MAIEPVGFQDYQQYDQDHEYENVGGVVQLPIASRAPGHRLIRLHGGYGKRTVKFTAVRGGRPPVLPVAADLTDDTLLGATITPSLPRPNPNAAGFDWKVTGTYVFAQNTARVVGTDAFPVGSHPFPASPATSVAAELIASLQPPSTTFTTKYASLGASVVTLDTGTYIWPFLALAPVFFSENLL